MTTPDGTIEVFIEWLAENKEKLADDILAAVWRDGLPDSPLSTDPALVTVVRSETARLLTRFVKGLRSGPAEPVWSPEARHVTRLAVLHETPLDALVASYRIAHVVIQDAFFKAAQEVAIPTPRLLDALQLCCRRLSHQITSIIDLVTDEYVDAVQAGCTDENTTRLQLVRSILNQTSPSAESPFYDLHTEHVAAVAGGAAARKLTEFAHEHGSAAISLFADRSIVWAWFNSVDPDQVREAVLIGTPRGQLGTGGPGKGVPGFRQSHHEAQSAYRVCGRTGRRSAHFTEIAPEAIGLADLDVARGLVHRHLGQLVGGDGRQSTLRKTLEVYLSSGQSARSTALKLGLTERTVANRLQAVRALLPAATELSSLELALSLRLRPLVTDRSASP
ncbi:hypothetical protein [Streptomyces sp. NBC_00878]|uniref:hypothetical protein n=1 Tax=Streptomyces sp. NBC_00878 TaxID=2975854 RepID=UPI002250F539|nr:hypothetical protein [Streptomyces sp. NBC_00878]MCX4903226.1 hypothetical protein [Streptomyces sp. NBC_00878]